MAAPCGRMATLRLVPFLSGFSGTVRPFSSAPLRREVLEKQSDAERFGSPWALMAAVCLQRLPVISAQRSPIEQRFSRMMGQMELEKSVLSDHELQLLEDAERMNRKKADDYDSDDEYDRKNQDIVLAQDLEDTWEQKFKKFQPAARVRADVDQDVTSVQRCLADSLFLLAEQQVGSSKLWLLPQTQWQEGETLRQTAERALASLPAAGFKATFLSNAPCGVYKYKLPKAARTESSVGTKVFFFKAILSESGPPAAPNSAFVWLKKSELQRYLKPAYMMKVDRFILDL
ncbi:large ribosomal subunit protein mL46 [Echeneis naucrates]|uniref:Large ribosomal subunit protein mL46 n=1 Tax=Echeneis naucrates TaxID=173247 RepID=A0A665W4F2_ECHNA|nr:39S ribosomal protein L46, mitochondrial [Echeneis naucrates]